MDAIIERLNSAGAAFLEFAVPMLVQSSVLILILLLVDLTLRKKVRAVFRYWIWLLVLAKLVLPSSLSSPLSLGYFFGEELAEIKISEPAIEEESFDWEKARPAPTVTLPEDIFGTGTAVRQPASPVESKVEQELVEVGTYAVTPVSVTWEGVMFLVWAAVVAAMGLLLLQRAMFVRGLVAQAHEASGLMKESLKFCMERMDVKHKVKLKVSANAASPAVCGLFRPVILVPANLGRRLGSRDLRAVLLHELAHIKRGDLWVNLAQTVLQIAYFYNPLLWFANAMIRRVREQAVDEMVLVAMGQKAKSYPETLVNVAKLAFKQPTLSLRLIGVVESKNALAGRIKRILSRPIPKSAKLGAVGLLAVVIVGAVLLPMAKAKENQKALRGIDEKVNVSDKAGELTINSLYMTSPDGKSLLGNNSVTLSVGVTNNSQKEIYLGFEYYTDSGTVAKVFSPGASSLAQIRRVASNWQGRIEFPMRYNRFVKGGYVKITLAKCSGNQLKEATLAFLPVDSEVLHEKKYVIFPCEKEKASKEPTFKKSLANGVTVELVGVCEHPSEGKQWWRPDGTMLPEAPYEKTNSYADPKDDNDFEIAFRFGGYLLDDINLAWKRIPGAINGTVAYGSALVDDKRVPDFVTITASFPKNQNTVTVPLGVAAGSWKSFAITDGRGERSTSAGDKVVRFEAAYQKEAKTYLMVWHNFHDAVARLIAIDTSGKPQIGNEVEGGIGKGVEGYKYAFEVPLKEITTFQLQTRPYQWATFKNVSLRPGVKTDVQVEGVGSVKAKNLVWGEDVDGLRAAVEFVPEKKCYSLGEEIGIRFHIQNVSDSTIHFTTASWRNDKTDCVIRDSFGKKCEVNGALYLGWNPLVRKTLNPGQIVILESASLAIARNRTDSIKHPAGHMVFLGPGQYSLNYELLFPNISYYTSRTGTHRLVQPGDWEGILVTGTRKLCVKPTSATSEKANVEVEEFTNAQLYQKQGSIRYALEFVGMPEELIDTAVVSKHGQLANPRQLEFANKFFSVSKNKDVDAFISLLSDGTKEQLNDGNNRRMLHNHIKEIKEGTFFPGRYDFKFFATFREFTEKDWNTLKKYQSFPETPTHAIVYWHFHKPDYMLTGSTFNLIEDKGSYKLVTGTLLFDPIIPVKKEQPTGPKEYGIVSFKQNDNAYTQQNIWKYEWDVELDPNVSENNSFEILKTTKVISGQMELDTEIAKQVLVDSYIFEKYIYKGLKFIFRVGPKAPRWSYGFNIGNTGYAFSMTFPGENITNVKPNRKGNFVGSDLELLSFETSEENIRYEHKVILRKSDSPEAKSAALLRLEQITRRRISNKKLQYLNRILTTYANDHNSKYPDRLEQIKPYDTDEWLDWLLENIEYLGKGKTLTETSNTVLAYDKTLLGKVGSTNVLFNDGPVQYCNPDWLKKLGITGNQKPTVGVGVEFGPVIERTLSNDESRSSLFIDFDSGELVVPPRYLNLADTAAVSNWVRQTGVDACLAIEGNKRALKFFEVVCSAAGTGTHADRSWSKTSPEALRRQAETPLGAGAIWLPIFANYPWQGKSQTHTIREERLPMTFTFLTHKAGAIGILQITDFTNNPEGIKIRYRLLRKEPITGVDSRKEISQQIKRLKSEEPLERTRAARKLGEMGEQAAAAIPVLIGMLTDYKGVHYGEFIGGPQGPFLSRQQTKPGYEAALALGRIGEPAVEPLLVTVTGHFTVLDWVNNPRLEELYGPGNTGNVGLCHAVWALGWIGKPAVKPLIAALSDDDRLVRVPAARALGLIKDVRAVGPLVRALGDNDEYVRRCAAGSLGLIGDRGAVKPLIAVLKDKDNDRYLRANSARALGFIGDERAVAPLAAALENTKGISDSGDLNRPEGDVRRSAASALGHIGDSRAVEPLIKALEDEDVGLRIFAAGALGKIGDVRAVAPLRDALSCPDKSLQETVTHALGRIQLKNAGKRLEEKAQFPPGSRMSVAEAISNPQFAFAAVCEAVDEASPPWVTEEGVYLTWQKFKVLELLSGTGPSSGEISMRYQYFDVPSCRERAIRKGEQVIWIVHWRKVGGYIGAKALADTPENQAAQAAVAKLAAPVGRVIHNTWDMAEFFVEAVAAGWGEKMQGFYHPEYSMNSGNHPLTDADKSRLNALGEQLAESNVKIANVYADRWKAVAVSSIFKGGQGDEQVLFLRMRNPMFGWKVTSFELKTAEEADSGLKAFLKERTEARMIDSGGNTIIEWGEPVEGLAVRLRPGKQIIANKKQDELRLDLRNDRSEMFPGSALYDSVWLEVDGRWYRPRVSSGTVPALEIKPGGTAEPFRKFVLQAGVNKFWHGGFSGVTPPPNMSAYEKLVQMELPLVLVSGSYAVRTAIAVSGDHYAYVYAISNPVEIKIAKTPGSIKPEVVETLIEKLEDKDTSVQVSAIEALGDLGPEVQSVTPVLISKLSQKKGSLTWSIARALALIGPAEIVVPALLNHKYENMDDLVSMAHWMCRFGADAEPYLIAAMKHGDSSTRYNAKFILVEFSPMFNGTIPELIGMLKNEKTEVRSSAADVLGRMTPPAIEAIPSIVLMLEDEDKHIRSAAISSLAWMGSGAKEAVPALIKATEDENRTVRIDSIIALGKIRSKKATEALLDILHDDDALIVIHATKALGQIRDKAAINGIAKLLDREFKPDEKYNFHPKFINAPTAAHHALASIMREDFETEKITSITVDSQEKLEEVREFWQKELQVEGKEGWGEAVEGVQCQLRPDKIKWHLGETPTLKVDVRNRGTRQLHVMRHQAACELWCGGKWYLSAHELSGQSSPLGPGREYKDIPISLDEHWVRKSKGKSLRLRQGRHTVRVAFTAEPDDPKKGKAVRVLSNPVEIEILPAKEKLAMAAVGKEILEDKFVSLDKWELASSNCGAKCGLYNIIGWSVDSAKFSLSPFQVHLNNINGLYGYYSTAYNGIVGTSEAYNGFILRARFGLQNKKRTGKVNFSAAKLYLPASNSVLNVIDRPKNLRLGLAPPTAAPPWWDLGSRAQYGFLFFSPVPIWSDESKYSAQEVTLHIPCEIGDESRVFTLTFRKVLKKDNTNYKKNELQVGDEPPWGEPVEGLQLALAFDGQERPYRQGELVGFKVYVRNVGDKEVPLAYDDLSLSAPGLQGTPEKPMILNTYIIGGRATVQEYRISLRPSELKMLGKVQLQIEPRPPNRQVRYSAKLEPGRYPVRNTVRFGGGAYDSWQGKLTSGKLELVVAAGPDVPWGEVLNGLRMRVTAPQEKVYRQGVSLPLLLELQNVSNRPITLKKLYWLLSFKVTDQQGNRIGVEGYLYDHITGWCLAEGELKPAEIIRETVYFERLPFRKPFPQESVTLCFWVPTQKENPGKLPINKYSNPITIHLEQPWRQHQLHSEDLPARWTENLDIVYRQQGFWTGWLAVHISGKGKVTMVANKESPIPSGRREYVVESKMLDDLISQLRKFKIERLNEFDRPRSATDLDQIYFCLAKEGNVFTGEYRLSGLETEPASELRDIMHKFLTKMIEAEAKKPKPQTKAEDKPNWGEAVNEVRARICREGPYVLYRDWPNIFLEVENQSNQKMQILHPPKYVKEDKVGWQDLGKIEILDSDGNLIQPTWTAPLEPYSPTLNSNTKCRRPAELGIYEFDFPQPGKHKVRITLGVQPLESGKTFKISTNWLEFDAVLTDHVPGTPYTAEQALEEAMACDHILLRHNRISKAEAANNFLDVAKTYPDSPYELKGYFWASVILAGRPVYPDKAPTKEQIKQAKEYWRKIISKWPDLVLDETASARGNLAATDVNQFEKLLDFYAWLTTRTQEQKTASVTKWDDYLPGPEKTVSVKLKLLNQSLASRLDTVEQNLTLHRRSEQLKIVIKRFPDSHLAELAHKQLHKKTNVGLEVEGVGTRSSRDTQEKVRGNFSLEKEVYCVGEPIFARFEIVNNGEAPFPFVAFGASYHQFPVVITNKAGRDFTKPLPGYLSGFVGTISLKPHGERYVRDVLVSPRAHILPAGDYVLEISRTLDHRALQRIVKSTVTVDSNSEPSGEAASVTIEGKLHFRIKAYDPNELKKCLAALGREDHKTREGVTTFFSRNVNGALLDISRKFEMGLSSTTENLREDVIRHLPKKWDDKYYLEADLDYNRNWLTGSNPEQYRLTFTILNNSNKTLESRVLDSRMYVNGKELKDWPHILSEELKDKEAEYIPAGASLKFSHTFNRYVKEVGKHKIAWQVNNTTKEAHVIVRADDK